MVRNIDSSAIRWSVMTSYSCMSTTGNASNFRLDWCIITRRVRNCYARKISIVSGMANALNSMTIFRFAISKAFICSLAAALNRMVTRFVLCKASLSITLRLQRRGKETLMDALELNGATDFPTCHTCMGETSPMQLEGYLFDVIRRSIMRVGTSSEVDMQC